MIIDPKELYLSQLRDRTTGLVAFRKAANQIARVLARQAVSHLASSSHDHAITLVPILRSGLAMLPAFLEYFPNASIGIIGLQRDKITGITHHYYCNLPPLSSEQSVIILDPMIATGVTACAALDIATQHVPVTQVLLVGIISAIQGIDMIKKTYPDVHIMVAAEDPQLCEKKFIVPGLGDFGDRYFGTME